MALTPFDKKLGKKTKNKKARLDEDDSGKQNKQQQANKQIAKKLPSSINIDVVTSSNSSGNSSLGAIPWDSHRFTNILERGLKMIHKISGVVPPPSGKTQPKQIKVSIQSPPNMPVTNPNQSTASNVTAACNNKPTQPAVEKENREVRISVLSTEPTRSGIREPGRTRLGWFTGLEFCF